MEELLEMTKVKFYVNKVDNTWVRAICKGTVYYYSLHSEEWFTSVDKSIPTSFYRQLNEIDEILFSDIIEKFESCY